MKKLLLFIAFIVIGLSVINSKAVNSVNFAVDPANDSQVIFEIEQGENASIISARLEDEGLIKSDRGFLKYLKNEELTTEIVTGRFIMTKSMTGIEIADTITTASSGNIVFTIPEGWLIRDIDEALFDLGLTYEGEFRQCAEMCDFSDYWFWNEYTEGFLFPDTFFLSHDTFDTETFIRRLLDNFESKVLTPANISAIDASGRTLEEIVIVASIIEKEVRIDKDRAMVSDIIWRRLDAGWMLGMCSTINYITGETEITYEDIQIDNAYNTRIYAGLPPTPISNPGLASIEAAIYPETNPYWFFLNATDTGETIYSITNEEHEINKYNYL